MSAEAWPPEPGRPPERRDPGTLLLFVEAGVLKACLVDKAQLLVGFVTVGDAGVSGALEAVERVLASGGVDWRPQRARAKR